MGAAAGQSSTETRRHAEQTWCCLPVLCGRCSREERPRNMLRMVTAGVLPYVFMRRVPPRDVRMGSGMVWRVSLQACRWTPCPETLTSWCWIPNTNLIRTCGLSVNIGR